MNINKEVKIYSKRNKYYGMSKIKEFLRLRNKRVNQLKSKSTKFCCKECGSFNIDIDFDDREYSTDSWLYCIDCGETYEDYEMIQTHENIDNLLYYFDEVEMAYQFIEADLNKSYEWTNFCDKTMDRMILQLKNMCIEGRGI